MNLFITIIGSILTGIAYSAGFISEMKGLTVNINLFQFTNILYS